MFGRHLRAGRYPYVRPYLHVRPSSASRSPSAYSALCCGQIAYPRAHIDTPGTKLSKHAPASSPTGTKLSQHAQKGPFQPVLHEQGELCTASTPTTPSRENFVPRPVPNPVQNSPNTPPPAAQPVQNSPCSAGPSAQPVQNSPNTPKKAHFSQFCTSRENFVPHPPPRPPAGRTLYRAQCQTRYKTPPTRPRQQPTRHKTLPAPPFYSGSAKKFAQHTPHHNRTAKNFAQHT